MMLLSLWLFFTGLRCDDRPAASVEAPEFSHRAGHGSGAPSSGQQIPIIVSSGLHCVSNSSGESASTGRGKFHLF